MCAREALDILKRKKIPLQRLPFFETDKKEGELHLRTVQRIIISVKGEKWKHVQSHLCFFRNILQIESRGYLLRAIKPDSQENENDTHDVYRKTLFIWSKFTLQNTEHTELRRIIITFQEMSNLECGNLRHEMHYKVHFTLIYENVTI